VHRVSPLASKRVYGVITLDTLDEIFTRRLLAADLLSRVEERRISHAAKMVRTTLEEVRSELKELILDEFFSSSHPAKR
jgi:hypothetical protein